VRALRASRAGVVKIGFFVLVTSSSESGPVELCTVHGRPVSHLVRERWLRTPNVAPKRFNELVKNSIGLSAMSNRISRLALVAATMCLSGCAMCANPFDCQYGAYGSRLPRADMTNGRVGSILDGSLGGIVSTAPIVQEEEGETYFEGTYGPEMDHEGEFYDDGEALYDEPQPIEYDSGDLYESPASFSDDGGLPASIQIGLAYDRMEERAGE